MVSLFSVEGSGGHDRGHTLDTVETGLCVGFFVPHPGDQLAELLVPVVVGGGPPGATVAGEDPFEGVSGELFHGLDLVLPGIPGHPPGGPQPSFPVTPQMVTAEQEGFPVEKGAAAPGVARNWNDQEVFRQGDRFGSLQEPFKPRGVGCAFVLVQDPLTPESQVKFPVVGDIILVGEKHQTDPAEIFDVPEKRLRSPRGVHQDIAGRAPDQVAGGPERVLVRVAAIKTSDPGATGSG